MGNQIYVATKTDLEQLIDNAVGKALTKVNFSNGKKVLDIMNVEQISEFLNISISTVYDKTSKNLIPHKKHGKKLYFIRAEIEKWILGGSVKTSEDIDAEANIELRIRLTCFSWFKSQTFLRSPQTLSIIRGSDEQSSLSSTPIINSTKI